MRGKVAIVIVLWVVLCLPLARADVSPNLSRGFSSDAFAVGDIDSINTFNGNLVIAVPLGISYPVAENFSYRFLLTYNANGWEWNDFELGTETYPQARTARWANAGFGWMVNLGRLFSYTDAVNPSGAWLYVAPDGSEHVFFEKLHDSDPEDPGDSGPSGSATQKVQYTRDGSYLRLKTVPREIEFPNGQIHKFDSQGRLIQMRDRFVDGGGNPLNFVNVTYFSNRWEVRDSHNRLHTFWVRNTSYEIPLLIDSIQLAAFANNTAVNNSVTETYTFTYAEPINITRACPHNAVVDPTVGATVDVPFLTQVTLPDDSAYQMPLAAYDRFGNYGCQATGVLTEMTLPTLGRIAWTWQPYSFPAYGGDKGRAEARKRSIGVKERTLKDFNGNPVGTWNYTPSLYPPGIANQAIEAVRAIVTPLGDKTENFFSVALLDSVEGPLEVDYALPYSRRENQGGRFRSTKTYDCTANPSDPPNPTGCVLKRSTWLNYEQDFYGNVQDNSFWSNTNRRVSGQRTVYDDDSGRFEDAAHSTFDGLGHYRQSTLTGSFDAGNIAQLFTNYNSTRGTWPASFTMLVPNDPWVLGTYIEQTRTEEGATAKTEQCFDTNTGFLLRTRTLKTGTARGNNDVISLFTQTAGNLTREEYFGGEVQTVDTSALCTLGLPANQYRIDHTWQSGVRKTSQYYKADGTSMSFKSLDVDIDANTGLVKKSRDTSLIATDYEYGVMGRLAWVKPESGNHDGWTQSVYTRALSASTPAQVQILRKTNGGGAVLAESIVKYDFLGRVSQEQIRMPDGSLSTKETLYNAQGWKASVSQQGNTAKKTQYLSYDPFGRPTTIRPPDGSAHDVTFNYLGVRHVSRTAKVGNSITGSVINEILATTQETYDRQGRLYQVREQAEATGNDTTTTYFYDVGNRLKRVLQATLAGTQNRWFNYDNCGFLNSEQHPEKGTSGNGSVSYSNYDARGHAQNKTDGPHNLSFVYDRAERLTDVNGNGGQLLKKFVYGTSNAAGVRRNGRLEQASRYNYFVSPPTATFQVVETYTYGGRQGRASQRNTQMITNGTSAESFTQTWTWNELGEPETIGYPECTFAGCTPVARSVSNAYVNGFLTSVPGWASSITYYANGLVNEVTHSNTVVDTQANDPNMMLRPSLISAAKGTTTLWSSGSYQYDGSGNVVKTGNGYFLYDRVSRLLEGRVYDGPTGGGTQKWQSYSYDPFGNILAIGGTSGRTTPTSSATNRLNGAGTIYDSAGNLTNWNSNVYEFDRFNQMTRMVSGSENWRYVYTAGDERIRSYQVTGGSSSLWALRDLDGRILREYEGHASWGFKDYIYRGSQLLASAHPTEGIKHFHLDHLGTPRLVTAGGGGDFYTLTPCRVIDTRDQSAPILAFQTRTVTMAGICGIPSNASAVSVNLTVVGPSTQGELTAYPPVDPRPNTSAISYKAGAVRSNNGMLKLGNGALAFYANQPSGSVHVIVDVNGYFVENEGSVLAYHVYYPFGEEATTFNQDSEQLKFTGHERDLASLAGAGDDLDYMHARHHGPLTGRFLSVDSVPGKPKAPQTWNRYSYALSNPVRFVDPNGLEPMDATVRQFLEAFMGVDLSKVDIKTGAMGRFMTKLASGAKGVTLGETIYLSAKGEGEYATRSVSGIALIGHEVAHVMDYQDFGSSAFLTTYFAVEAIPNFMKHGSQDKAYNNISFEKRGATWEKLISTFLRQNQDIASKLEAGQSLNASDKNKIADFMIRQLSSGQLKLGYQFVNGELVQIRLYPPQ